MFLDEVWMGWKWSDKERKKKIIIGVSWRWMLPDGIDVIWDLREEKKLSGIPWLLTLLDGIGGLSEMQWRRGKKREKNSLIMNVTSRDFFIYLFIFRLWRSLVNRLYLYTCWFIGVIWSTFIYHLTILFILH